MRLLSPILQRVIYPAMGSIGYFHSRASAAVITYHGVLPPEYRRTDAFLDNTLVSINAFRSQLSLLKQHYNVISPELFLECIRGTEKLPTRAVLLTCDDGLLNNLTVMTPILQEYGLQCLFFVTGTSAGENPTLLWYVELYLMLMEVSETIPAFEWNGIHIPGISDSQEDRRSQWLQLMDCLSRFSGKDRTEFLQEACGRWGLKPDWKRRYLEDPAMRQRFHLLGAGDLKELGDSGMSIGAHTMSHPMLSRQSPDLASEEISRCRVELQNCTRKPVWALAYPYGTPAAVGEREFDLARIAGYECAFMNIPGRLEKASRLALPRVHVTAEMSPGVFEAHVSGVHETIRNLVRRTH
jgi:peptidoglycan/xylan/chitin deacetylase (PgdA/CDA1 family)